IKQPWISGLEDGELSKMRKVIRPRKRLAPCWGGEPHGHDQGEDRDSPSCRAVPLRRRRD
ncbi:MAG: hypothetical protein ACREJ6_12585, partial [Candidatus Methylomirabilis sp.]